jgi:hypothetical protein
MRSGRNTFKAHRESFRIHNPEAWDPALHVLHSCDNPRCVNPAHLRLGSHQDNMQDAKERGRFNPERGADRYNAKLDPGKVRQIRRLRAEGISQASVAKMFDINPGTVSRITRRLRWKHVE